MSVHRDRGAWVVRWRHNGAHPARRFKAEGEAVAFDEGLAGGSGSARSSTPDVYPYVLPELPRSALHVTARVAGPHGPASSIRVRRSGPGGLPLWADNGDSRVRADLARPIGVR
jgi:hypothetical protein